MSNGILLPIFSIYNSYGIGDFGKGAYAFVDYLDHKNQRYWQILPLSVTAFGDSPYQSPSLYAINPYFIDLDELVDLGLLLKDEIPLYEGEFIDYGWLYGTRYPLLKKAFERFSPNADYHAFVKENEKWLTPFGEFMKNKDFWCFLQFFAFRQWRKLKKHANQKGIKIIGDMPLYPSVDSAELFYETENFIVDLTGSPALVAGVPPDAYAAEGQLWGNPLYNWEKMRKNQFDFWKRRIRHMSVLYDVLRIDHFIGLSRAYAIFAGAKSALRGFFLYPPSEEIIDATKAAKGKMEIIAEDLGLVTPEVEKLLAYSGFPGMRVVLFGFDGNKDNPHLPQNYPKNSVAYTSTHDSPPLKAALEELTEEQKAALIQYYGHVPTVREVIDSVLASKAKIKIIPLWDYLELGEDYRINRPGTTENNWRVMIKYY